MPVAALIKAIPKKKPAVLGASVLAATQSEDAEAGLFSPVMKSFAKNAKGELTKQSDVQLFHGRSRPGIPKVLPRSELELPTTLFTSTDKEVSKRFAFNENLYKMNLSDKARIFDYKTPEDVNALVNALEKYPIDDSTHHWIVNGNLPGSIYRRSNMLDLFSKKDLDKIYAGQVNDKSEFFDFFDTFNPKQAWKNLSIETRQNIKANYIKDVKKTLTGKTTGETKYLTDTLVISQALRKLGAHGARFPDAFEKELIIFNPKKAFQSKPVNVYKDAKDAKDAKAVSKIKGAAAIGTGLGAATYSEDAEAGLFSPVMKSFGRTIKQSEMPIFHGKDPTDTNWYHLDPEDLPKNDQGDPIVVFHTLEQEYANDLAKKLPIFDKNYNRTGEFTPDGRLYEATLSNEAKIYDYANPEDVAALVKGLEAYPIDNTPEWIMQPNWAEVDFALDAVAHLLTKEEWKRATASAKFGPETLEAYRTFWNSLSKKTRQSIKDEYIRFAKEESGQLGNHRVTTKVLRSLGAAGARFEDFAEHEVILYNPKAALANLQKLPVSPAPYESGNFKGAAAGAAVGLGAATQSQDTEAGLFSPVMKSFGKNAKGNLTKQGDIDLFRGDEAGPVEFDSRLNVTELGIPKTKDLPLTGEGEPLTIYTSMDPNISSEFAGYFGYGPGSRSQYANEQEAPKSMLQHITLNEKAKIFDFGNVEDIDALVKGLEDFPIDDSKVHWIVDANFSQYDLLEEETEHIPWELFRKMEAKDIWKALSKEQKQAKKDKVINKVKALRGTTQENAADEKLGNSAVISRVLRDLGAHGARFPDLIEAEMIILDPDKAIKTLQEMDPRTGKAKIGVGAAAVGLGAATQSQDTEAGLFSPVMKSFGKNAKGNLTKQGDIDLFHGRVKRNDTTAEIPDTMPLNSEGLPKSLFVSTDKEIAETFSGSLMGTAENKMYKLRLNDDAKIYDFKTPKDVNAFIKALKEYPIDNKTPHWLMYANTTKDNTLQGIDTWTKYLNAYEKHKLDKKIAAIYRKNFKATKEDLSDPDTHKIFKDDIKYSPEITARWFWQMLSTRTRKKIRTHYVNTAKQLLSGENQESQLLSNSLAATQALRNIGADGARFSYNSEEELVIFNPKRAFKSKEEVLE